MKYFLKNKNSLTWISQFGEMGNLSDCYNACHAKRMNPLHLEDFYNYADQIQLTEIFHYNNQSNTTQNTMKSFTKTKKKTIRSEICIDVKFDFKRRKWTDDNALEQSDFIPKWEGKFKQFWDNKETTWPPQPYQPEFVILNYEFLKDKNIHNITMTIKSITISPSKRFDQPYFKCLNRNDFQKGSYYDAFQNCKKLNSSIQTYFDQVSYNDKILLLNLDL